MEIKGPSDTPLSPPGQTKDSGQATASARPPPTIQWQTGQILEALVVKADPKTLMLNIQGTLAQVTTRPAFQFESGQRLAVQVMAMQPEPQLKIIPPPQDNRSTALPQALRHQLPLQQPLTPLLANIEALARKTQTIPPMPKAVKDLGWNLYQQIPPRQDVSRPDGLKHALQQLGPFFEHTLARMAAGEPQQLEQNISTTLRRLAIALREQPTLTPSATTRQPVSSPINTTPAAAPTTSQAQVQAQPTRPVATQLPVPEQSTTLPANAPKPHSPQPQAITPASLQLLSAQENGLEELLRQVDGALSRINVQQLQTVQSNEQGRPVWILELPVRTDQGIDLFDMRIQQDEQQQQAEPHKRPWTVTLAFDLQGLGPVKATVTLLEQTVSARFWAERNDTLSLFSQYMDTLRSQLNNVGLEVAELDCQQGIPDDPPAAPTSHSLDEQA